MMKVKPSSVHDALLHMRTYFQVFNQLKKYAGDEPLRSELFSADQMEQHGKSVASTHALITGKIPDQLLKRLTYNEKLLIELGNLLANSVKENKRISPAAEWLLDNFYLIKEQIAIGKKHLPKGYSLGLPRLANGPSAGMPRVYDIALEIISHSDGRVDLYSLSSFVAAYQTVTKLTLGELWAIPIMLRLTLIENLRRVSSRIATDKIDQNLATYWSKQMIEAAEKTPKDLILLIADMARSNPPLTSPFVAELTRRLQGKGPALAMALTWMEQQLSDTGFTSMGLIHFENQKQAADQVSVSNSIGSLRFLGATDWRDFVETLSSVEQILRKDIGDLYSKMDFSTRDHYRHVVESISKNSNLSEPEVAQVAINLARKSGELLGSQDRSAHVGYYLIDKGLSQMETAAMMRVSFAKKLVKVLSGYPFGLYTGSILLLSFLMAYDLTDMASPYDKQPWLIWVIAVLSFLASSHLAVALVNWASTILVRPELLPRMDFSKGIPLQSSTLVVIPTMLSSALSIELMIEGLEVRFLANTDEHLHFALLTDFLDGPLENMPDDDLLLHLAKLGMEDLNQKYKRDNSEIFFLFHRPRRWNPRDRLWMGYERKRGKLGELNALLRGKGQENFSLIVGDYSLLTDIKYVISLDNDTRIPREAAWQITATMAHPLNRPVYNEKKQRVTEGFGILQPRVALSMSRKNTTRYMRMHDNDSGIDPYTRVTSDVYQDIFGEGSYIGKGIYEVDIFEKVLHDTFPENRILSHDLLEGCYVRSGLLSDVQLYEEYPASYQADVKRRHRWIRGDWQIGGWMLPLIPGNHRQLLKNRLSRLSRWKIFDNLRRSLESASFTILLLLGWTVLPFAWNWTLTILAIIIFPFLINDIWCLIHKSKDQNWRQHLWIFVHSVAEDLFRILFAIASLPYEAYYMVHAIILTNWRMIVSNRGLLEWTPSGSQKLKAEKSLAATYRSMWFGPFIALLTGAYLVIFSPLVIFIAEPVLILWVLGPALAWWLSRPIEHKKAALTGVQYIFLQKLARKTWSFFEHFIGPQDNWLPPDNYQEHPVSMLAHRTSPTNMGLSLLANITAYDFGYISGGQLLRRTGDSMQTMQGLERHHGHFFNWYNTQSLQPLFPRYISTVDSGNLAGHLLVLRQGILTLPDRKIISVRLFEGLRTTLFIIWDLMRREEISSFIEFKSILDEACDNIPTTLSDTNMVLSRLYAAGELLLKDLGTDSLTEKGWWAQKLLFQVQDAIEDLGILAPWLALGDIPAGFPDLAGIDQIPTLFSLTRIAKELLPVVNLYEASDCTPEEKEWLYAVRRTLSEATQIAKDRISMSQDLAEQCIGLADMDYGFLYDKTKHLLSIGYSVEDQKLDLSYYDLLASEARLCNFVVIAQSKLPQESWFALGRSLTNVGGESVLLSWSGSMFEYLMPLLIMPSFDNTLLEQTEKAVVKRQMVYGRQRGVPWGISESGYNMVDANLNYQYRAFGVPGLGLKRGLVDDLVIAPYASMLALMVDPREACINLQYLSAEGFEGRYGYYEAIDYTPSRLPRAQSHVIVRSFMVHHQGMSLLSLAYLLLGQPMQKRFESDPRFQATLLLLQERIPRETILYTHTSDIADTHFDTNEPEMRIINSPDTPLPELQLLSNGKYQVVITAAGGGYSKWNNMAATRWREDATCDHYGIFCYIKDMETKEYWSNTFQPTLKKTRMYQAVFSQGHVEFRRRDNGLETKTEIVVSPEDDIELRRVSITNRTLAQKVIEVTSYAEIVLDIPAAEIAQPAFSNLFVQTEVVSQYPAIVCTRRPRSQQEIPPWLFHLMTVQGAEVEAVSYETDRAQFLGRGNTVVSPKAMEDEAALSGSQGSVLDPIVAIRYRIVLKASQTVIIDMIYGMVETRENCQSLIEKYQDKHLRSRAFELSWTHSQVLLRQINATEADAQLYDRLAGSVIFVNPALRADQYIINSNRRGQSGLWSYSISGDLPIVLLLVHDSENIDLVKRLVQAHAYWRLKGLAVDLVIWNEEQGSYRQELQDQILGLITGTGASLQDKPGGIYIRSASQISNEDRILFQTVAHVIFYDNGGTLVEQINKRIAVKVLPGQFEPTIVYKPEPIQEARLRTDLLFFNGIGGFSQDGREYIITTSPGQTTPAPWVNVIANPDFGMVISEGGSAYTWAQNAHEFRLTPWENDPISDTGGEFFYLRDEESGHLWSPTPLPMASRTPYTIRHGFGYSVFEHSNNGIRTEMWVYVDIKASIKFSVLKIRNLSDKPRKLSVTGYVEWVLGDLRSKTIMHIITEPDPATGILFSTNRFNTTFEENVSFFDVDGDNRNLTTDRTDFIGRNGTLQNPGALHRTKLSDKVGYTADPCTAIQIPFDLYEGQEKEIVFRLGSGKGIRETGLMAQQFKGAAAARDSLERVQAFWQQTLEAVQVDTPDKALNLLANGWLVYQVLSCRLWARSGYYQSGGAFGFRDQLQDVLSLLHTKPKLARDQILLSASRQFKEGDVQHWWHPPSGKGVRTRCSDDYLWLPFVLSHYLMSTGDKDILKEPVSYLEGRKLNPGEESYYDQPMPLDRKETLYNHCVWAIRYGLSFGVHGLPLMGSGDWNDGMDKVGIEGKGESVWLGFFLYDVLMRFAQVADSFVDAAFSNECKAAAMKLRKNLDKHGWDGDWYKRAYFDDGMPLGSASNTDCQIDSISQSWSVLSEAGEKERPKNAMEAVDQRLVRRDMQLIQLLDPAFNKGNMFPGYIKGYVPGVRENGGQYTHAAIWTLMAFAKLGNKERVWELFSMINPINHGATSEQIGIYMTEPYVIAADVYAAPQHIGRGGWTWYTGSAGWAYQFVIGSLLGLTKKDDKLYIEPCIPASWPSFKIRYRNNNSFYQIEVCQTATATKDISLTVDGIKCNDKGITLIDDGLEHLINIELPINLSD